MTVSSSRKDLTKRNWPGPSRLCGGSAEGRTAAPYHLIVGQASRMEARGLDA